ncbi:MAG: DNA cytosine methyltransferase [Oscillospiraceae bacterium]|nr:DNA cytosine methyltransferase [Oscillospiraceae bacterium]
MKRVVDLFAGCGGLSQGFEYAGFDIVGAFEYWDTAAKCYAANFSHPVYSDDLSNVEQSVKKIKQLNPEIIIGGPPCQDFSHAGKRIENERAALTECFASIITTLNTQWFLMENVDRAHNSKSYAAARHIFKTAGYGLTEVLLNAALYGVPQRRKRFFCIGSLGAPDGFLLDYIENSRSEKEMTLRDYFGNSLDFEYYYRHPRNYCRRAIYSIDEPSATIRGVNRPVPLGYPGHANDACQLNPSIRSMTTLERSLVQTFPPDYKWLGNKTETEQMIGNAVPVKLAEFVAKALAHHISAEPFIIDYAPFFGWLQDTQIVSEKTQGDVVSRLKRANSICPINSEPDAFYLFTLEQTPEYKAMGSSVRSQLKRAVTLYSDYLNIP